jgi:hypothetical protein
MTIRDILFPMFSYPTATSADRIGRTVTLAAGLGGHIAGVTFELDIRSPAGLYAHPVHAGKVPPMHAISLPPLMTSAHVKVQRAQVPRMSTRWNIVRRAR